jgi:hypothetical protein
VVMSVASFDQGWSTIAPVATTDLTAADEARLQTRSAFSRGEVGLAHTVYGLILIVATLGELVHYESTSKAAVVWLLGAGAVLVAAHLFSDVLAHVAATQNDPQWSELISIGREDMAVGVGAVGAATIMAVAALADLDSERALTVCVVLALVAIGAITIFATPQHRTSTRLLLSGAAVLLGSVIVLLENTF